MTKKILDPYFSNCSSGKRQHDIDLAPCFLANTPTRMSGEPLFSISLGNSQRELSGLRGEAPKLMQSMDELQVKVGSNRLEVAELLIELEKERLSKKRIEDDLDPMSSKANSLREKTDNSAVLQKLHHEVKEYRGILKCGICHERQKECYHLFCNQCIQKSLGSRQKRCPSCGLSFGANDVKPIYI